MSSKNKGRFTQTWTDDDDQTWDVVYHFDGRFYPGTHEDPPEYPELVIDSITGQTTCLDFGEPTQALIDFIEFNHAGQDEYDLNND